MSEIQSSNNESIENKITKLHAQIIAKVTNNGSQEAGLGGQTSVIRFSPDHRVAFDSFGCLSVCKFHHESIRKGGDNLEGAPYCTNMMFDETHIDIGTQVISPSSTHKSSRKGFEGVGIATGTHTSVQDPSSILKYYESLDELVNSQPSQKQEIEEVLGS